MGRILGLDVGDKTIGVCASDLLGITAQGITVIKRTDLYSDLERLINLIDQYEIEKIIIGLPKNMDGTLGFQGNKVMNFFNFVKKRTKVPTELWDERLTSAAAERTLIEGNVKRSQRKEVIDMIAAQNILQNYLDANLNKRKGV